MRSSKSRSRNKNNRNRNNLGNVVNRVFDSSGPEGKVRGTPQQIIDKYNQLARDAQLGNDRVAAENFQQHAEHYLRMLSEAQKEAEAKREQQERENRERQAQRDRERAEREAQKSEARGEDDGGNRPQSRDGGGHGGDAPVAGSGDQPDVLDMGGDESGLVETPEDRGAGAEPQQEKPKRSRAPRKPRKKPEPKAEDKPADGDGGSEPTPDAAE